MNESEQIYMFSSIEYLERNMKQNKRCWLHIDEQKTDNVEEIIRFFELTMLKSR